MDTCQYEQVNTKSDDKTKSSEKPLSRKPFIRQLLICSGLWTTYFVSGLALGAPTVVIPQFRRATNSTPVSDEMASWLSSALSFSAMPWVIILPTLTQLIGRKIPFMFACISSVASFTILYFSITPYHFLISEIVHGTLFGSNLTVSIIMVTEYTSPQYRGVFLTLKSASVFWGVWASNALGTFLPFKYIALFGLVCSVSYLSVFMWPESPYWLASKGRFEECAESHRWLKGIDENSEKELQNLIDSQREYLKNCSKDDSLKKRVTNFCKVICCSEFYKPISLCVLVMAQFHTSGKVVCSIYSIELIKKITESESTAYVGMLVLDGVSVFGMYFGCILAKFVPRRSLLLWSSSIGITFLFSMSLYLWLVKTSTVSENKVVTIALLAAFSVTISCGPMIMSTSIYGELIPLRFKSSAVIVTVLVHFTFLSTTIKVAPYMFNNFSLHGTFSVYGLLASTFTVLIYKYLPETKDKTLQEIEEYFKDKTKSTVAKEALIEHKVNNP